MNVEKISDNTAKVEVSSADFRRRSINPGKFNMDSPACAKLIQEIVRHAEVELGTPITAARISVGPSEDKDVGLEFIVSDISGDDISGNGSGEEWNRGGDGRKIPHGQPETGVPQFIMSRRNPQNAEEEAQPPESGGNGSIAEAILRRIMFDGLVSSLAQRGKSGSGERPAGGAPADPEEFIQEEENGQTVQESVTDMIESRRREIFGEGFSENGGTAVAAFPDYNTLYTFVREYSFGKKVKTSLYEYAGGFYLVLEIPPERSDEFIALDRLAAEYRGMMLPPQAVLPVLREHGRLVFARRADDMIRKSMN